MKNVFVVLERKVLGNCIDSWSMPAFLSMTMSEFQNFALLTVLMCFELFGTGLFTIFCTLLCTEREQLNVGI